MWLMLEKIRSYAGMKVLEETLGEGGPFYMREFAKKTGASYFMANSFLRYFEKEGILLREKKGNLHLYRVNQDMPLVRHFRIVFNLMRAEDARLVKRLKGADPGLVSLVLYGSWSRGDNRKESDLDLVAISLAPKSAFAKALVGLERDLGASIELQVFTPQKWKSVKKGDFPFYMDVIAQGIVLYGSPVRV